MEAELCSKQMIEDHKDLLTRLRIAIYGNGDKGLLKRMDDSEKALIRINTKLTVMIVFMGILIVAQVPSLLKLFGIML